MYRVAATLLKGAGGLFTGGKWLLIVAAAFFSLWGYNRFLAQRVELAHEKSRAATELNVRLGKAVHLFENYERDRRTRDQLDSIAHDTLQTHSDSTLDLPVPAGVVRVLRPEPSKTNTSDP